MLGWLPKYVKRIDVFGVGVELREPPVGAVSPTPPVSPAAPVLADVPSVPATGFESSLEAVLAEFIAAGGRVGKTASPDGSEYHIATSLWYVRCRCGWDDETYGCHEYIGRTLRGVCFYISHNLHTGLITFGRKGFHYSRLYVPECV